VPTTLGVGEALVRASSGNTALALLLLVGTNALGIGTMPPWLKLLLSQTEGLNVSVDALKLFYKLLVTVLAPALVGKVRWLAAAAPCGSCQWQQQGHAAAAAAAPASCI
jgi:sodium/bile acid cotransporter 7